MCPIASCRTHPSEPSDGDGARRGLVLFALIAMAIALLAACTATNPSGQELKSSSPRAPVRPELLEGTASATNAFAVDLYRTSSHDHGNFAYSPYAILRALSMARAGSDGTTRAAFDDVLNASSAGDLDGGVNAVDAALAGRAGDKRSETRRGRIELEIATALWGQRGTHVKDGLLETFAIDYGTGFRVTDFRSDAEAARQAINRWGSDATAGHIQELVPRGDVTQYTRFLATAASYLQAPWQQPFDRDGTEARSFERLDDQPADVQMMHITAPEGLRYASLAAWTAVEVPYLGDELALDIVMPADGQFESFEQSLTDEQLHDILAALSPQPLDLRLPRFQFTTTQNLQDPLTALGLGVAFSREADFSGVTTDDVLSLSEVMYQGFFGIDEEGTDATNTATAEKVTPSSVAGLKTVVIDRPFVFVVRDRASGLVLLIGRVVNPN